uniref:heparinase II/III domain-containing protein n=1 Tax=Ningiella ruwaisensis TaxID=2364274 RepID=UPI0010A01A8C|nr:heparinase II/III family protein [Ningiella ruwaisensis]
MHLLCLVLATLSILAQSPKVLAEHPNLVITKAQVPLMREALESEGRFKDAYTSIKAQVDAAMQSAVDVPIPKDGGGGYTHERHKKNYQLMLDAAKIYQLSGDVVYANFVRDILIEYAHLYPTLDVHPARKVKSQNPGKLFWQSLNEAVWLVHTIQAYDLIYNALETDERKAIEQNLLRPVALFLSEGQPSTFDKVHNHGTWATAGVGMAGYVLDEPEWVEKALLGLDKSGKGGFLRQLDELFSPQGYYNEGPYYQRYALMPFVTFASAIENNEPEREIFSYRDNILLKAIDTTIQLSYNGLFYPINDAIKSKGIDTIELVHGVTVAYGLTQDPEYLDIARQQAQIILSGDGLKVAQALDMRLEQAYTFDSVAFGDGSDGKQGALVIMRSDIQGPQAVLFKPAAQGLGHGHFDKLTWQFYDKGAEIVSDYGAARFLNVEAKFGGRYLPENESYAKQTVAHNTVVVDEISHFNGDVDIANQNAPKLNFFQSNEHGSVASAEIDTAYEDILLQRTIALIDLKELNQSIVLDIFDVSSDSARQFDLPLHYHGQIVDTSFELSAYTDQLSPLGENNGYQHLWLKASASPEQALARVTWLHDNGRFYSQTSLINDEEQFLFTQIGANDPNFNLRNENGFIRRVSDAKRHRYISVLEPHGEYNPSKEYTLDAQSSLESIETQQIETINLYEIHIANMRYLIAINTEEGIDADATKSFSYKGKSFNLIGHLGVFLIDSSN